MDTQLTPQMVGKAIQAWKDTLVVVAQERNFKDGAFKKLVTSTTNVMDGFDIFIASPLLSKEEKTVFSDARAGVVQLLSKGVQMTFFEYITVMLESDRVADLLDKDTVKQGKAVPPWLAQSIGKDDKVEETFEITNEGTKITKGGEYGVAPSAPQHNYRDGTEVSMDQEGLKVRAAKKISHGDGSECSDPQHMSPLVCAGLLIMDSVASEGGTKSAGFDEAFKLNLRRAFG